MSGVINQIEKAIKAQAARQRVEIPEWGTEVTNDDGEPEHRPLVAYYHPMTIADTRLCSQQGDGDHFLTLVYIIIRKLEDEEGNKIFTVEHKDMLATKAHRDTIMEIANRITQRPTLEGAIKK